MAVEVGACLPQAELTSFATLSRALPPRHGGFWLPTTRSYRRKARGWWVGAFSSRPAPAAGVAVLLSGHTHVPSTNVVPLDERGRHWAVAVGSGTTLSHRTRGTPNAYGVLHLNNPTGIGPSVTLDIRQAEGVDWSLGRRTQFVYTSNGVATCDPNSE